MCFACAWDAGAARLAWGRAGLGERSARNPFHYLLMHCQVETYSGFRLHERPRRFTCGEDPREVRHVLRQWLDPDGLCFVVAADDGCTYLLKYHQELDTWEARRLASVNF